MIPVILSGGSGTRLWPVSRQQMPKQFCEIFEKPLQSSTLQRCLKLGAPWIVTSKTLQTLTERNLKQEHLSNVQVVYEPYGRNTAPAIAVLCHLLTMQGKGEEIAGIFPSDHLVLQQERFLEVARFAEKIATENKVVTLGITPTYPETGYGYIQTQKTSGLKAQELTAFPVLKFHEKPNLTKAQSFLAEGNFSWNAGIFFFRVSHMAKLFAQYQPEMWKRILELKSDSSNLEAIYNQVQSISIDYAIMEHLSENELVCIPTDVGWNDVGSWDAVAALSSGQKILNIESKNNFVFGASEKHYSVIGVDDVIVVDTADALLLIKKGQSQNVRQVVENLSGSNPSLLKEHAFEYRPWGYFEILKDTENFKSKVIRINPHSQISYQSHAKREEHWTITQGVGEVVLDDKVIAVQAGSHIHIPVGAKHRIRNNTNALLEFVEVQLGSYFGEDDIVRYQDDYQRI